jgi:UDP-glucuronate 4-epimerase
MKYIITGSAGFIGAAVALKLLHEGQQVVGVDNLSSYYDVNLKQARLKQLQGFSGFSFHKLDISEQSRVDALFSKEKCDVVIHLAAQPGVRHSIDAPMDYASANFVGHLVILEACRHHQIQHLVYASSSSVYGLSHTLPLSCDNPTDHPVSLYAASKKSNELMSHSYSHLYNLPTTGLRFFTVYGPWGRPDMAPFKFTQKIIQGEKIDIYNNGELARDFTYIDDIVEGIVRVSEKIPEADNSKATRLMTPKESSAPYRLLNIGNGTPVNLLDFVHCLEEAIGIKANLNMVPMQPGDVYKTWADTQDLFDLTGYRPKSSLQQGVTRFVAWYKSFYGIQS